MRDAIKTLTVLSVLAWIVSVGVFGACSPKGPTVAQVSAEGTYGAALLKCVDDAKTLADSKACRARVDASYGIGKDGGR